MYLVMFFQTLYIFVLRAEKITNTNVANFIGLYFPHFTTFCNYTLHFTNFRMCFHAVVKDSFSPCLQNVVCYANCPLKVGYLNPGLRKIQRKCLNSVDQ